MSTHARVAPAEYQHLETEAQRIWDAERRRLGRITQMKRTFAHDAYSFDLYMRWYELRDRVAEFLGDRPTLILSHAISAATDCLICSTYFRRALIERGEDPDALELDDWEKVLVRFGQESSRQGHQVSDEAFAPLKERLSAQELVTLVAFCGQMVATNLFNNVLRVELDEELWEYRPEQGDAR